MRGGLMTTVRNDRHPSPQGYDRLIRWRDWVATRLNSVFAWFDAVLAGKVAWISAVAFVLALQVVLTTQHRPWLDEWQALQLAEQSPRMSDLMFNLRYEGHPPLWYLLLRAIAALFSDPVRALPTLALSIAIPVQLLILFGAPFSRAERVMISLSQFVLFEYLTLSRSLTLGFALMVLIAALWKRPRLVWLLIAILPQCDFLFGAISVLLVALRWREGRLYWPFALLWLFSGLFAAWSVRTMPDMVPSLVPRGPFHDFALWTANLATLGLPLQWNDGQPLWNWPPPPGLGGPALLGFLAVAWVELRKKREFLVAFGAFVALTMVFSISVYQLSNRHLMLAAALLIILVWRMADEGGQRSVWWRAWLLVASLCGLLTAAINLIEPFDAAPEAAGLINRMGLHDKTWVAFPHSAGESVAAINAMTFERLAQHCSEDMVRWNAPDDHRIRDLPALRLRFARKVAEDGRFYLLSSISISDQPHLIRKLGKVAHDYDGQAFYFYVIGEDRADARPHGIPCITPLVPLRRSN
jgi:hypothetical protein